MINEDTFDANKYGCALYDCEYGKCDLLRYSCQYKSCPILYWISFIYIPKPKKDPLTTIYK